MGRSAPCLVVSPCEHTILEAVVASSHIPVEVQTRAQIILHAAAGEPNTWIAKEVSRGRAYVIHWRNRFLVNGIRGLWNVERPGTKEKIAPDKERAIVWDTLYGFKLRWTIQELAMKYRVSSASVHRIWTKYGITVESHGVNLDQLKISQDPLFGVTVSRVGLYYETCHRALALAASAERPFRKIRLAELSGKDLWASIDTFLNALRLLDRRLVGSPNTTTRNFIEFLEVLEARRKTDSNIHLLVGTPHTGVHASKIVRQWLDQHSHFQLHPAPNAVYEGRQWTNWVQRWLRVIAAFPVQAELVDSLCALTEIMNNLPNSDLVTIAIQ